MNKKRRRKRQARAILELHFRGLRGVQWRLTSPATKKYNCLAWVVGDTHRRWDGRDGYWPNTVSRDSSIDSLLLAYMTRGYEVCFKDCRTFDPDFDKIVLYVQVWGIERRGMHAAKLMPNGMWSSKIGNLHDIEHPTPEDVIHRDYGVPEVYMRKPRSRAK